MLACLAYLPTWLACLACLLGCPAQRPLAWHVCLARLAYLALLDLLDLLDLLGLGLLDLLVLLGQLAWFACIEYYV